MSISFSLLIMLIVTATRRVWDEVLFTFSMAKIVSEMTLRVKRQQDYMSCRKHNIIMSYKTRSVERWRVLLWPQEAPKSTQTSNFSQEFKCFLCRKREVSVLGSVSNIWVQSSIFSLCLLKLLECCWDTETSCNRDDANKHELWDLNNFKDV